MDEIKKVKKVLIVEDEKILAKTIELKLLKDGFEVKSVFSGKEGLEEIKSGEYDMALLDIMLPEVSEWDILKSVLNLGLKTKIVVTSNLAQPEDQQKAMELGAGAYLVKSNVSLAQITQKVTELLQ